MSNDNIYIVIFILEYVNRFATKEAADAATDESSSEDEVSSVDSYSDDDEPEMEL